MEPKLCEILGVEVNQWFEILGSTFYVREDGSVQDAHETLFSGLTYAIEHPDQIHILPIWNETDIKDAKAIKRIYPSVHSVDAIDDNKRRLYDNEGFRIVNHAIIPSLKTGIKVPLDTILNSKIKE